MIRPLDYIFIDTSVFMQEQFFKESGRVSKLLELAYAGYIRILLPVITEQEWRKHFLEDADIKLKSYDVERKLALLGKNDAALDFVKKYKALIDSYDSSEELEKVFADKIAQDGIIRIDYPFFENTTASVFDKYFKKEKPFGPSGKSKEFPDAFVLAALEKYAQVNELKRIVVFSQDKDMTEYSSALLVGQKIGEFLNELVTTRIPDADKKEKQEHDINKLFYYINDAKPVFEIALKERIEEYLSDTDCYISHFCYADIDDVKDIEISLDITAKDMEIISITDETIEAICFPEIDGNVKVRHFSEEDSLWDSEDKEWIVETYNTSDVEISSYCPVTVRMERNELEMGQEPHVEIIDVDFRPLQISLNDENY